MAGIDAIKFRETLAKIMERVKGELMLNIDIYQIDAFSSELFKGNPAAVCLLEDWIADDLMQKIAQENNLSETAFIVKKDEEHYEIRWMAPEGEVDLCGHATIASAYAVTEFIEPGRTSVTFTSRGRELPVRKTNNEWQLKFPRFELTSYNVRNLDAPLLSLVPSEAYFGNGTIILVLPSEEKLLRASPDIHYLRESNTFLSLTTLAAKKSKYDFASRFFAPSVGIDEDPVTGSVHCLLGPLWAEKLQKNQLKACQRSRRGGNLSLIVEDDCVYISGGAAPYLSGKLLIES